MFMLFQLIVINQNVIIVACCSIRWSKAGFPIWEANGDSLEVTVDHSFFTDPVSCEVSNSVGSTNVSTLVDVHCEFGFHSIFCSPTMYIVNLWDACQVYSRFILHLYTKIELSNFFKWMSRGLRQIWCFSRPQAPLPTKAPDCRRGDGGCLHLLLDGEPPSHHRMD